MGVLFDLKRFAVHDGPGLRTTAFLKGCTLRCNWCHSPESHHGLPELSYCAALCIGCGACASACPMGLLGSGPADLDRSLCQACGACTEVCYAGALQLIGYPVTARDLVELLDRDAVLHEASGGGVTISGGEPGLQADFVVNVLAALRRRGRHTVVETAGHVAWPALAAIAAHTDVFLYDLKHARTDTHQAACGAGNELILSNLRRLAGLRGAVASRVTVRVPLVPGFNDSLADLERLAGTLAALPRLEGVEILPYHNLGVAKYAALGRAVACPDRPSPSPSEVGAAAAVLAARGLVVKAEVLA